MTWAGKQRHGCGGDGVERKQKGGEQCQASWLAKTPIRSDYGSDEQLFWVSHPSHPFDCRHVCRVHRQFQCRCLKVEPVVAASTGGLRASSVGSSYLRESLSMDVIIDVAATEFLLQASCMENTNSTLIDDDAEVRVDDNGIVQNTKCMGLTRALQENPMLPEPSPGLEGTPV